MLSSSFRKKISSVNSQLSKEINFKILFCNLKHVLFCKILRGLGRNFTYGALRLVNLASVYKHQTNRRCWLSKVYFQCESAYFRKKNFQIFIIFISK